MALQRTLPWLRNRNQFGLSHLGLSRPRHNHNGLGNRNVYNYPTYDDYCGCDCEIVSGQHVCTACALRLYQPSHHACACTMCDYFEDDEYAGYGLGGGCVCEQRTDPRMMLGYPNRRNRSLTNEIGNHGLGNHGLGLTRRNHSCENFPNYHGLGCQSRGLGGSIFGGRDSYGSRW